MVFAIVAETTQKSFGQISLENQNRNFLTVRVTENSATNGKFARDFNAAAQASLARAVQRGAA